MGFESSFESRNRNSDRLHGKVDIDTDVDQCAYSDRAPKDPWTVENNDHVGSSSPTDLANQSNRPWPFAARQVKLHIAHTQLITAHDKDVNGTAMWLISFPGKVASQLVIIGK